MRTLAFFVAFFPLISGALFAHSPRMGLADKHAPAGLMGDHLHDRGEWMIEYKYMNMYMEDNRIGTRRISDQEAIGPPPPTIDGIQTNGGATPTQMTMEMHMLHVMYGASDDITLYGMVMLPSLTMDHIRGFGNPAPSGPGSPFTTHNSGFGDTAFGALMRLCGDCDSDVILNLGCWVPTGRIYRETSIPTEGIVSQPLPYPMRLGGGTFSLRPGLTAKQFFDHWSIGGQLQTELPIGRNYRDYRIGDEYRLNTWASVLMTEDWSLSLRVENLWRSNFYGADPQANNLVISTNVEPFRGGYWLNLGAGTQFILAGHYFNAEIVPTLAQNLNGIQLETDFAVIGSWSKSW